MRKRRHCGFPNSIEILWRGGKREFFTSFLSRDEAFRLIMMAWHNNRQATPCKSPMTDGSSSRMVTCAGSS